MGSFIVFRKETHSILLEAIKGKGHQCTALLSVNQCTAVFYKTHKTGKKNAKFVSFLVIIAGVAVIRSPPVSHCRITV